MGKQTMGEFLAVLRKANGYTQQEVADKLNISNRTLSSWETDRTTPDILLLPAIADLYKVTVDEILRGERGTNDKTAEFSDKAVQSMYKLQYSKFSFKNLILTPCGCFAAFIYILATLLMVFTNTKLWVIIFLMILGLGGVFACGIMIIAFYNKAKQTAGIVCYEDYTDDKKEYALALKRKAQNYFWICAIPFLIVAFALHLYYFFGILHRLIDMIFSFGNPLEESLKSVRILYIISIIANAVAGCGLILAFLIFSNAKVTELLNESQKQIRQHNKKLLIKICLCALFPFAVVFILMIIAVISGFSYYLFEALMFVIFVPSEVMVGIVVIIHAILRKKQTYKFY